jgi:hypothetical protein
MKVKFCFSDNATNENDIVTLTVKNMSSNEFEKVFNQYIQYLDRDHKQKFDLISLTANDNNNNWSAIFTTFCSYFGNITITGDVYEIS